MSKGSMVHPLRVKAANCASCTVCEGNGYQTPPVLFAGNPNAKILAIGQNPGEIKESDTARQRWMDIFNCPYTESVGNYIQAWYTWDFTASPGYSRMAFVFGGAWILDGLVAWTNAVRCRTQGNAAPSLQMVENCRLWTNELLSNREAVVMVGKVARDAILDGDAAKLEWGVPRRHPKLGIVLAIKHYSAWSSRDEAVYAQAFQRVKEALRA